MLIGFQLIAIVFSLIMVYFAFLHYSRKELNGIEVLSWMVIWLATIVIVIFPNLVDRFVKTFAISRVFDLMVMGGFIILIPIVYLAYVKTKRIERKFEEFIRAQAIKNEKKKTK